jgi:hypothetical protein
MANEKWKRPLLITLGSDAVFLGTQIRRRGLDFYEQDGFWTAAAITVTTDALMTYVNLGGFSPLQRKVGTGAIVLVGSNAGQLAAQGGDLRGIDERRALIEAAFGVGFVVPSYRFAEGSMGVLKNLTGLSDGPLGNAIVLPLFSGRSVVANQAYTDGSIYLFEPPPALGYPWWPQAD